MIYRVLVVLGAVAAGAAGGALVFKIVGEERVGSQVRVLASRFGFKGGNDAGALDVIETIAPGTKSGFEGAVIGTVVAALITTAAITIAIREIAE